MKTKLYKKWLRQCKHFDESYFNKAYKKCHSKYASGIGDQFFIAHIDDGSGTYDGAGDADQTDLWQDGDLELNTRDVITGTWSIKLTTKLAPVAVTASELAALGAAGTVEDANGLGLLMNTIKGAAVKLNKNVIFASGNEIWNEVNGYHNQVTFITPQFCKYYGLLNYK